MKTAARNTAWPGRSSRPFCALFLLALFLTLQLFASSSELHHKLHSDANSPDHHCALTLLTHGQVDVSVVAGIWLQFAIAFVFSLPLLQAILHSSLDLRLDRGRAPPRF